jgi:SM-20-related protein
VIHTTLSDQTTDLTNVGLWVRDGFFDGETCASLRAAMDRTVLTSALVVDAQGYHVDERVRKAALVGLGESASERVVARLRGLMPALSDFFGVPLQDCAGPEFVLYRPGDFFRPHRDASTTPDMPIEVLRRKVSCVIFLNAEGDALARDGSYAGGTLTFLGLNPNPTWYTGRTPLRGATGRLVAFRSDTVHEVTPVLRGQRYTIVTWFYS